MDFGEGMGIVRKTFEAAQFAKRFVDFNALVDGNFYAVNIDRSNTKCGFLVIFTQAIDQIVAGRNTLAKVGFADRRQRVAIEPRRGLREISKRLH